MEIQPESHDQREESEKRLSGAEGQMAANGSAAEEIQVRNLDTGSLSAVYAGY